MIVFTLGCTFLLIAWLVVMLRGQDAWPFSHYPMFAHYAEPTAVEVFRLALETQTGEVIWWRSRFYRYPERVGRELQRLHYAAAEASLLPLTLARQRCLLDVLRLIQLEEGSADRYCAFQIVRRTVVPEAEQGWRIQEQTIARLPFAALKGVCDGH